MGHGAVGCPMGGSVTEGASAGTDARRRYFSPFAAFGVVAALAIGGALWEDSYYASAPALSGAALGTTLGIAVAAIVFFWLAWRAPPNN